MPMNGHLEWNVGYHSGSLTARGYKGNKDILLEGTAETSGDAAAVQLITDRTVVKANGEDVAVISVQVADKDGVETLTRMAATLSASAWTDQEKFSA